MLISSKEIVIEITVEERNKQIISEETCKRALALFKTQGFLKITGIFDTNLISQMHAAFLQGLDTDKDGVLSQGSKVSDKRYIVPIPLKGIFNTPQLYANTLLMPILRALLGEHLILSSIGAVTSLPGALDQHIHTDYFPLFEDDLDICGMLPTFGITMGIPLINIDTINGPTKVWAGSHRNYPKDKILKGYERHLVYADIGSCYFWDYRTFHAGGSNFSEELRPLLYLAYTRRWFNDLLNDDFLLIEEDEWKKIPAAYAPLFLKYTAQKRRPSPVLAKTP